MSAGAPAPSCARGPIPDRRCRGRTGREHL